MTKKFPIYKVRDPSDKDVVVMHNRFDISFRLLLVGRSGMGKTSYLTNIFLNTKLGYVDKFHGDNLFFFSPNIQEDNKLKVIISEKNVPKSNLFDEIEPLETIYDLLVEEARGYMEDGKPIPPSVIVIDDFGFSGAMSNQKRFNAIQKVFSNGRKFNVGIVVLIQAYSMVSNVIRSNATGLVIGNQSNAELERIEMENNYLMPKKNWVAMFRTIVREKHDALIINYSNSLQNIYQTKDFEVIDYKKYM